MPITEQFDKLINGYNEMLKRCHDALEEGADQGKRNELRQALSEFLKGKNAQPRGANGTSNTDTASRS